MSIPAAVFRYRALWLGIGYVLVALTAWFSLDRSPPGWAFVAGDKVLHAATYALLVYWFGQLYPGTRRRLALVLAFVAFGGLLEVLQGWSTVARDPEIADLAADAAGALVAFGLLWTPAGRLIARVDAWLPPAR